MLYNDVESNNKIPEIIIINGLLPILSTNPPNIGVITALI